ncbi:hypothetical protein [Ramlibacter sp. WS9]|uniref:hypothetical protein n=1 Tax=Ramlibacter sp. WS9 TaxID=1882741 RepID=UPI0011450960|nr:hypothetical protein [Ramlibacter sp. WS9]ROZ76595.1 hypothetical protein EEB15_12140 [Ramlibacter sp. WS9]
MATKPKQQAFFVVGHSNWGKSRTLKAVTGNSVYVRHMSIGGRGFAIRRRSNDDIDTAPWAARIAALQSAGHAHLLLALCPTAPAAPVLRRLARAYDLYFWVMKDKFRGTGQISPAELAFLRGFGKVSVFSGQHQAPVRARALTNFIVANP